MKRRTLILAPLFIAGMVPGLAESQGAPRRNPVGFTRDSLSHAPTLDSTRATGLQLLLKPAAQDSAKECQSSYPYVLLGGLVGAVIGSARYEKESERSYGGIGIPLLTMPLIIGPYILGGMFLGYLFAPC